MVGYNPPQGSGALGPNLPPASLYIKSDGTYWYGYDGTTGALVFGGPNNVGGANGQLLGNNIQGNAATTGVAEAAAVGVYDYLYINTNQAPAGDGVSIPQGAVWIVTNGNNSNTAIRTYTTIASDGSNETTPTPAALTGNGVILTVSPYVVPGTATAPATYLYLPQGMRLYNCQWYDKGANFGQTTATPKPFGVINNIQGKGVTQTLIRAGDASTVFAGALQTGTVGAVESRALVAISSDNSGGDIIYGGDIGTNAPQGADFIRIDNGKSDGSSAGNSQGIVINNYATGATAYATNIIAAAGSSAPVHFYTSKSDVPWLQYNANVAGGEAAADSMVFIYSQKTTGKWINVIHSASTWSGDFLFANLGRGAGSFTGNFLRFQRNAVDQFVLDSTGVITTYKKFATAALGAVTIIAEAHAVAWSAGSTTIVSYTPLATNTFLIVGDISIRTNNEPGGVSATVSYVDSNSAVGITQTLLSSTVLNAPGAISFHGVVRATNASAIVIGFSAGHATARGDAAIFPITGA